MRTRTYFLFFAALFFAAVALVFLACQLHLMAGMAMVATLFFLVATIADGVAQELASRRREKFETVIKIDPASCNKRTILMILQDKVRHWLAVYENNNRASHEEFYRLRNAITPFHKLTSNQRKWSWWTTVGVNHNFMKGA